MWYGSPCSGSCILGYVVLITQDKTPDRGIEGEMTRGELLLHHGSYNILQVASPPPHSLRPVLSSCSGTDKNAQPLQPKGGLSVTQKQQPFSLYTLGRRFHCKTISMLDPGTTSGSTAEKLEPLPFGSSVLPLNSMAF